MANDDDLVTIQYAPTKETREVFRAAIPGFPGWDVLKSDGSVNPKPAAAHSTSNPKD